MLGRLLLLFTLVPLIELAILLKIGSRVGFLPTLAGVIAMGLLGAWLARQQGFRVLMRVQEQMARGEMPTDAMFDGALILVAATLLVTPGVLTDVAAVALLFPPTRNVVKRWLSRWAKNHVVVEHRGFQAGGPTPTGAGWNQPRDGKTIDVEVVDAPPASFTSPARFKPPNRPRS